MSSVDRLFLIASNPSIQPQSIPPKHLNHITVLMSRSIAFKFGIWLFFRYEGWNFGFIGSFIVGSKFHHHWNADTICNWTNNQRSIHVFLVSSVTSYPENNLNDIAKDNLRLDWEQSMNQISKTPEPSCDITKVAIQLLASRNEITTWLVSLSSVMISFCWDSSATDQKNKLPLLLPPLVW